MGNRLRRYFESEFVTGDQCGQDPRNEGMVHFAGCFIVVEPESWPLMSCNVLNWCFACPAYNRVGSRLEGRTGFVLSSMDSRGDSK